MKLKFNYIFLLFGLLFMACEEEEYVTVRDNVTSSERYVYFSEGNSGTLGEAAINVSAGDGSASGSVRNSTRITVQRTGNDRSEAVTLGIEITSSFLSTTEFQNEGDPADSSFISTAVNEIVIPAGSANASFLLYAEDDLLSSGDKSVTFTITSASGGYTIGFPGDEISGETQTVIIQDDDCPIDIPNVWEGLWEVEEAPAMPGSFNEGFSVSPAVGRVVELVLDESNPAGTSAILQRTDNPDFTNLLTDGTSIPLQFNTCPGTVLIGPDFYNLTFNQNSAVARIFRADEPDTFGNGSFNEDGSTFTLVVSYGNVNGSNFDEFGFKFTKVEVEE